jgi:hypothetical protein
MVAAISMEFRAPSLPSKFSKKMNNVRFWVYSESVYTMLMGALCDVRFRVC